MADKGGKLGGMASSEPPKDEGITPSAAPDITPNQGAEPQPEVAPETDHPAGAEYQDYVKGEQPDRGDTGVAGMPAGHGTPLGAEATAEEPAPSGSFGLDSVPDEAGRGPHPDPLPSTRAQRTPEDEIPLVKPGDPAVDASMEPGTLPASEQDGSTEWYEPEAAAKLKEHQAAQHSNPLG